jgi:hypothetical protein
MQTQSNWRPPKMRPQDAEIDRHLSDLAQCQSDMVDAFPIEGATPRHSPEFGDD